MPPAPTYPQQMMTQMCNDWQAPMYNVSANGHMPPFMAYAHPGYNLGAEIQEMNYGRENGRRNSRGRSIRRDNYNRTLNPANEVQSGYMGDQAQYHPQIPIMYIYSDHSVSTQQHQVATGQIYYTQPMYSSILHPHPNAQSVSSNSHAHPTYPQPNHQAPQINRSVRQSQSVPSQQSNQEPAKQPVVKSHEHIQSTSDKSAQQVNENNSLQSNVVNTVIVNNLTSESSMKNENENTANKKNVTSDEKIDAKFQHNIVWTVNENCNGTEKVDVPYVNTNIDVKINQNNETDKKLKNEIVPRITTNAVQTSPKPISIKTEKSEVQIEENIAQKDIQDKTIIKTPNDFSAMPSNSSTTPTPPTPPTPSSETLSATTTVRSYASLLRKDNTSEVPTACKPTEHIVYQNESPKTPVRKESISPIRTPEIQNLSDAPTLQNGILQNCYDDPNTYRIGGKYKKIQSFRMIKY